MKSTREIGNEAEAQAAAFLELNGYIILERNYHFEQAEIDIVAYSGSEIVFVEVKYRSTNYYGTPEEAVTDAKQALIFKAADAWLYERKMERSPVRFDVISVSAGKADDTNFSIRHIENAFGY